MLRTAYLTQKENKVTELTLLGFKTHCKATVVKTVWETKNSREWRDQLQTQINATNCYWQNEKQTNKQQNNNNNKIRNKDKM